RTSDKEIMENIALTDQILKPNEDIVFAIIGEKRVFWQQIMTYLHTNHTDISEVWKFYNDGKRWLFRTLKKKDTIFWIGVLEGTFIVTFWFGDRAEPLIEQSGIPETVKNEFSIAKRYNKIRAISIKMTDSGNVETVQK